MNSIDRSGDVVLGYVTVPDHETARRLAQTLVAERLVACVNILGPIESIYWWEGAVETSREIAMLVKTRGALQDRLVARIRELHPYQIPCVLVVPVLGGHGPFLRWICDETSGLDSGVGTP
ncbi:MAG: divalent-cation tolerance protein CutA [Kiritimatiellae bacterium]|nr:divalent-cation tolerance protein CutA [Kiritimatiellia bacterium]MDW8457964.1 divalent-cation tolerance protein CutA [Verrucomicrobiota bacterium]